MGDRRANHAGNGSHRFKDDRPVAVASGKERVRRKGASARLTRAQAIPHDIGAGFEAGFSRRA